MSKNVKFNNMDYNLDENKLAPIQQILADYLTNELAGTGATIYFGDKVYSVNGTKIANATDKFTNLLSTIEGTDSTVIVGGRSYGLNKNKLADATTEFETVLNNLKAEVGQFSEGLQYRLNDDGASYSVIGIGTCTDRDVVIPETYNGLPVTALKAHTEYVDQKGMMIPNTVGAFQSVATIATVVLPQTVTVIGARSFCGCRGLQTVVISNSLKTTEWEVFTDNDYGIIKVVFQGTVEEWENIDKNSLGAYTYFNDCTNMDILCSDDRTLAWYTW